MPKTSGEYRAQAWGELKSFNPNALGSLVISVLALFDIAGNFKDAARKPKGK